MKLPKGTIIYTDRLYTSIESALELDSKFEVKLVGTIMPTRSMVPECLTNTVVAKRNFVAIHSQNINVS